DLTQQNQTKDNTISSLTKDNNNLKTELSSIKSQTANQRLFLFIVIAICVFLAYKLLADK
ncbi:MAG TPA: hypothetical protein VH396_21185, partial [Chitinophagaceae bacterium]